MKAYSIWQRRNLASTLIKAIHKPIILRNGEKLFAIKEIALMSLVSENKQSLHYSENKKYCLS